MTIGAILVDLVHDRCLDAQPVIGIGGIHEHDRDLRIVTQPGGLLTMIGKIEKDTVTVIPEPNRRQARSSIPADDSQYGRNRSVKKLAVDVGQLVERRQFASVADGELPGLEALGDIKKRCVFKHFGPFGGKPTKLPRAVSARPADHIRWTVGVSAITNRTGQPIKPGDHEGRNQ